MDVEGIALGMVVGGLLLGWLGYMTWTLHTIGDVAQATEDRFNEIETGLVKGMSAIFNQVRVLEDLAPQVMDIIQNPSSDIATMIAAHLFGDSSNAPSAPPTERAEDGTFTGELTDGTTQDQKTTPPEAV